MHTPYPYQEELLRAIAAGRNVILVVPTGGGKTFAASLPFLQNLAFKEGLLPAKAIYAVPTRSLATQYHALCQKWLQELNPDLFDDFQERYGYFGHDLFSIQTGETPGDPQFESVLTACTIDQFLASALGVPYSLDTRRANINVGAMCSSYLILDEPHLYPVAEGGRSYKGGLTTCLEFLRQVKDITRFVFMSATLPQALVEQLAQILDADVITVDDEELAQLNKRRERRFERCTTSMSATSILQQHQSCSLVVCNTVQRAQEIYLKLDEAIQQAGLDIDLRLLHSRFTDDDRKRQGEDLSRLLGKEQWLEGAYQGGKGVIVVATQVVEVGLDISVEVMHTEIAPANSLIQRAGRCARFEQQHGRVLVYRSPLDEDEQSVSSLPYEVALCEHTWQALERFTGQPLGFREEQALINEVHTASDLQLLQQYEAHRGELQEAITTSLRTHERGNVMDLIRDVLQVQLLIHNAPDDEITTEPWRWQSFAFRPGQLMGKHWERLQQRCSELGLNWICKQAILAPSEGKQQEQDEDSHIAITYTWDHVNNPHQIPNTLMLAMPNQLVTYDQRLGLVFLDGRLPLSPEWELRLLEQNYQSVLRERKRSSGQGEPTRLQCYEQHIGGLADAYYQVIYAELAYTMQRLETRLGLEAGTIDHAIQLAIATHDLGKLADTWQTWARAWQRLLREKNSWAKDYQEPADDVFFAKTDYDWRSQEQRKWQKEVPGKRPNHSCESVMIGRSMLAQSLGIFQADHPNLPILRAVCTAIAHHHTPKAHEYGQTRVQPGAFSAVEKAIQAVNRDDSWSVDLSKLCLTLEAGDLDPITVSKEICTRPDVASSEDKRCETWLSFVIVRALRLADQRADRYVSSKV
ncbi:CRISPR-associated helicase Cas3' [Ktedonospora formicarum]|uniref:CRISPR-associated helicase/endonuclease Cas3 n=1 Tax=Ktedonospora formicarum TaxID=2778364 RepID=A0A8J3I9H0_9CHLR|nr:CRISPR-associated helicase Cas3' [Ktedonospora formicarum]GHO49673.1 CRISPR-associated helicase/endonuclease Cas3 [Ktedonospora formicarum]